jgi:putative aminopeptidase FrvX
VVSLLAELALLRSPPGREAEMDAWLEARVPGIAADPAGNRILRIAGTGERPPVAITAHKDEIAAIVKRVEPDGRLRVSPTGDAHPWIWGEAPLDLLGDAEEVAGVLSFGARHVSPESPQRARIDGTEALRWADAWVETKRTPDELAAAGVRPGTRAVLGRSRRVPVRLGAEGAHIACPALDDKLAVAVLVLLAERLDRPRCDVELVFSAREEIGCEGVGYFAARSPADTLVAVEVAPTAAEYGLADCTAEPVLMEADGRTQLHYGLTRELADAARSAGLTTRHVVVERYGSDASSSLVRGHVARAACLCAATDNTHGCEIAHLDAVPNLVATLATWLDHLGPRP